ncbi:Trimeric GatFAB AmidoTransferase(AdT) complex subunit [Tulasnella sp. JGI-2019a]|nr:Trimeric GatFAB AmidoTransferase(AdT) complex subunit [Tulasnella sp. JGI-2019a]KAG9018446.1 Trimeric GatFAB AmidoTransferase(AdT) complex subunit [Tulasnella sp. JGI-2019a]KAG9031826.1 Trimeric GatFAB AmidoTransferase(AdT) complex subunit [Tulasnella sp. JGI-2019a]
MLLRRHAPDKPALILSVRRFSSIVHGKPQPSGTDALRHRCNAYVSRIVDTPGGVGGSLSLSGKAIAIKDNIATSAFPTTCSSAFLKDFRPSYDATVVQLIAKAGGHICGKTNCDEFGMGSFNINSVHGPVVNPFCTNSSIGHDEDRSAGGSSGGSAAAVAADLCYAALGTDTGGSIRLPASYCGVAGFKPSYGIVSRWGVVAFADSLDCVGVLAKNTRRIREVFDVIGKYDGNDPTSAPKDVRQRIQKRSSSRLAEWGTLQKGRFEGIRIGIPREYFPTEMQPSVRAQFRRKLQDLKAQGATIVPVTLPSTELALSAYYVLASAEASSNLARYDGMRFGTTVQPSDGTDLSQTSNVYAASRSDGFGPEVKKRILLGTHALTADAFDNYFLQAQRIRQVIKRDFDQVFNTPNLLRREADESSSDPDESKVDILLHPTAISSAPRLSEPLKGVDGYLQDIMTTPASLAGLPALSVPSGFAEDGWPLGMSLVGQWGDDDLVLHLGESMEQTS